jgi:ankyrin repeat protein
MARSATKRRLSEPSSSSSTESVDNDSESRTKSSHETEEDECDILKDLITKNEVKLYADLPDPNEDKMSPDAFLNNLVYAMCGVELEPKRAKSLEGFFAKVTDEQIAAYTMTVVSACRSNDLDALKKLHTEEGQTMNCFNRFGESLLTMACRRGFEDIVEYLLNSPDLDIRISDDSGRTVLHDACWNPSPQLKICQWIMERDPALFFIADNRGCTPFQYARPEHWGIWRQFLLDNKDSLQALRKEDVKTKLAKA